MKQILSTYYGDNTRWFIGKAKTVDADPLKLGRIRVRIFGLHTDDNELIKDTDLPWATVSLSLNIPSGYGNYQSFGVNDGDTVFGIFLDGQHSQSPLVLGVLPHSGSYQPTPENLTQQTSIEPSNIGGNNGEVYDERFKSYESSGMSINNIPPADGEDITVTDSTSGKEINGGKNISKETRDSYIEIAFDFFNNEFQSAEHAAAIIGNLIAESDMNPTRKAGVFSENSWGIAQWNGSENAGNRLGRLQGFAKSRNQQWNTLEPQLHYIMYELTISKDVGGYGRVITFDSFKSKTTLESAVAHFMQLYENPGVVKEHLVNNNSTGYFAEYEKRLKYAQDVLNSFYKEN